MSIIPVKFCLKNDPSLPMNLPKSAFFGSSDWASDWLVTDPVLALVPRKYLYWRLPTPINCIPHPCWMYTKCCFSTLRCCGWAYGCILMIIHVQVRVNFRKTGVLWPSLYDVVVPWLRLQIPIECILHPYWMYTKCFSTLRCCGWAYGHTPF